MHPNLFEEVRAGVPRGNSKIALLEKVPLFRDLSRKQLEQVARLTEEIEVSTGKQLANPGERGLELFVIVEGQAIVKTEQGRTVHLGPGDYFGEMSLIDGAPRSATVEASSQMRLLVVGRREFWSLLDMAPSISRKIMYTLSRRLRQAEAGVSG